MVPAVFLRSEPWLTNANSTIACTGMAFAVAIRNSLSHEASLCASSSTALGLSYETIYFDHVRSVLYSGGRMQSVDIGESAYNGGE